MLKLPDEFIERAKEFAGKEHEQFISSLSSPSPVSLRLNPFKRSNSFSSVETIPWSSEGRYLEERPSFTLDPYFHAGCYYVQDASSQFLEIPFLQAKNILNRRLKVLDLCAAPGGKSTHILSMLAEDDVLVSNEMIPSRNNILRQNIIKWGCANVIVTQNDPSQLASMKGVFDIVVIDAPCSGEGLFRKDNEAVEEWSVDNVRRCAVRQMEILSHAVSMLRPDGFLIYSTCTFEQEENDDQVERLINDHGLEKVSIDYSSENILKTKHGLAFFPHRIRGEGFYISMLRNNGEDKIISIKPGKVQREQSIHFEEYISSPEQFVLWKNEDRLYAIPKSNFDLFSFMQKNYYLRLAGVNLGELKGNDFIPSDAIAFSKNLNPNVHSVNLRKEDALTYLRGGSPAIDAPNGFVLVRYDNFALGWVKKINQRINNYYPKGYRIHRV
jgi:16S rRNA C967 or C1407 C5-methylase (RsmB/RsmF family)/NOL1/NOP2/fmu family ribosome biogenesis protein